MGYNTVAFVLNDFLDELKRAPHATVAALLYPPYGVENERERQRWRELVRAVAEEHGEPVPHFQAIHTFPTFHADNQRWFHAGGNWMEELKFLRYGKTKDGKLTVTLELPEGFARHPETYKAGQRKLRAQRKEAAARRKNADQERKERAKAAKAAKKAGLPDSNIL